ncbi:hypothetical protein NRIC_00110 [Enterococcus florum]|uniref:Uncharacterized protein n=1 Tax=Enterococcus florum TaxID=2480627 RepID=A0A4P5P3I2_9ENTE|nr:hypothetical protein NRIC_00110 [Enterococcus florum]
MIGLGVLIRKVLFTISVQDFLNQDIAERFKLLQKRNVYELKIILYIPGGVLKVDITQAHFNFW